MANKLSHSSVNRYKMCGESYRLHYIERIRSEGTSSALLFGAALDNALNVLLTVGEGKSPEEVFEQSFTTQKLNNEDFYIPKSTKVSYSKADHDFDLLTEVDLETLEKYAKECGLSECGNHTSIRKELSKRAVSDKEQSYLNLASWFCLYRKGMLMIKAYREKVLPKVIKVHEVQREFSLDNGAGDKVTGLIDLVAEIEGHGLVILDNKTAGRPYEKESARNSEQLALYLHVLEEQYPTRKVGYIVLLKNVNKNKIKICRACGADGSDTSHTTCNATVEGKRCHGAFDITMTPEVNVQIIIDEMSEEVEQIVLANTDTVNTMISEKRFDKNEKQCHNWFGSKCPYFDYCHANKDMKGLKKL